LFVCALRFFFFGFGFGLGFGFFFSGFFWLFLPVVLVGVAAGPGHRRDRVDLLVEVHFVDLLRRGRVLRILVVADAHEPREPERDPLGGVGAALRGLVHRRDRQVRGLDLPHLRGLEPHVALHRVAHLVVGLGAVARGRGERRGVRLEILVAEAGAGLADRLVALLVGVVAGFLREGGRGGV
jgi:hypothetical protein